MINTKLKIYDNKNKVWIHKEPINLFGEVIISGYILGLPDGNSVGTDGINDLVPLQYTGLTGLNGANKEIELFEGDVLFEYPAKYWTVYFDEGMFMISCKQEKYAKSLIDGLSCVDGYSLTYIGNIYDNPELKNK